jgi:peptide/nickel transport system ATP-binding protein/oligopeptide transport system ATP-binding protein
MVFQDPSASLDPLFTVGHQLEEVLRSRTGISRSKARRRAVELLARVEIPSAEKRVRAYPHEFSGGMKQRVMIALALAAEPHVLLADEPTTGLDVTIQDQILFLLLDIRRETGMAIVLVSHDMGVIAQVCDRVAVMYAGYLVEVGSSQAVFQDPCHPYTRALLEATPRLQDGTARGDLRAIGGQPPAFGDSYMGCPYYSRCPHARESCLEVAMALVERSADHVTACPFETSAVASLPRETR